MNAPLLPALPGYDNPQLIAHGTTALVFRAIQTTLNRPVAIKVITVDTGSVPVNAERELAMTVALSSQPHIVSIIDTGTTEDDRPYIVMEYCEGGSYAQILRHNGPLPVDDVLEVGVKIGEALHAAHQVGIVHRDVKPSNILRSRFGPALTDFGIARAPDELSSTLTREMMTPHHASPEALLHQAQSGPSDIYSLASTMWTLLVGHPPFVDPAKPAIDMYLFRDKVLNDPLPTMPRADVPAWLVGELRKAMSKLPAQRHFTAMEFAESLRRGALGLSPSPSGPSGTAGLGTAGLGTAGVSTPGTPAGPATAAAAVGGANQVHVPGVPAQAWPGPDLPMPPVGPISAPPVSSAPPVTSAPPVSSAPPVTSAPPIASRPVTTVPPAPAAPMVPPAPLAPPMPAAAATLTTTGPAAVPPQPQPTSPPAGVDGPVYRSVPPPQSGRTADALHPLSGADRPPLPAADEGGWLGAEPVRGPGHDWPDPHDPTTEALRHTRRMTDRDVPAPSSSRRGGLLAVFLGVALIAVASAALLLLRGNPAPSSAPPSGQGPSSSLNPTLITAKASGAPTDLRIETDRGTSVTLAWTDVSGGVSTYVALQRPTAEEKAVYQTVKPGTGTLTATFTGLKKDRNYCFAVTIVRTVSDVSTADVCTKR